MSNYQCESRISDAIFEKNEANNSLKVRGECGKKDGWQIQQKSRRIKTKKKIMFLKKYNL